MVDSLLTRRSPLPRLLLRKPEAAEALAVSVHYFEDLVRRGEIPKVYLPGRGKRPRAVRFAMQDLKRWVARVKISQTEWTGNGTVTGNAARK
jgi:excisionase family DNA binding protein